jgi:hypothetical protein
LCVFAECWYCYGYYYIDIGGWGEVGWGDSKMEIFKYLG